MKIDVDNLNMLLYNRKRSEVYWMNKEILNMEEASELFGVSVKTFIKLLKEEKVPARKIGREWRFSRKALIDWLSSGDSQYYSSSEGDTREFFDQVAPEWDEIRKNYYDESIKHKIISLKLLKKAMTIVDLGCGDGYISRGVAKFVKKVVAVDISGEMLKELRKKAREGGIKNIETLESNGLEVPVEDSSIDTVFANMYIHHIANPEDAIKEMYRIVKPGGHIFVAEFHEHEDMEMKEKMHDIWPGFSTAKMQEWCKAAGFRNIVIETLPCDRSNSSEKVEIFTLTAIK